MFRFPMDFPRVTSYRQSSEKIALTKHEKKNISVMQKQRDNKSCICSFKLQISHRDISYAFQSHAFKCCIWCLIGTDTSFLPNTGQFETLIKLFLYLQGEKRYQKKWTWTNGETFCLCNQYNTRCDPKSRCLFGPS